MSNDRIYYDDAEYARWLQGGPAPTPRYYQETPVAVKKYHMRRDDDQDRDDDTPAHKGAPKAERRRNPTALFRRSAFARQQNGAKRFLAILLFLVSVAGAVIWGGGGPAAWAALTPLWWGVVGALVLQGVMTYGQWVFGGPGWWNPLYLLSWGVSTLTTVLGYWPLVFDWLTTRVRAVAGAESTAGYYAPWIAGAIIVAVAAGLDWLPEQTLLD